MKRRRIMDRTTLMLYFLSITPKEQFTFNLLVKNVDVQGLERWNRQIRVLAVLLGDASLFPSTQHIECPQPPLTPAPGDSALSSTVHCTHMHKLMCT